MHEIDELTRDVIAPAVKPFGFERGGRRLRRVDACGTAAVLDVHLCGSLGDGITRFVVNCSVAPAAWLDVMWDRRIPSLAGRPIEFNTGLRVRAMVPPEKFSTSRIDPRQYPEWSAVPDRRQALRDALAAQSVKRAQLMVALAWDADVAAAAMRVKDFYERPLDDNARYLVCALITEGRFEEAIALAHDRDVVVPAPISDAGVPGDDEPPGAWEEYVEQWQRQGCQRVPGKWKPTVSDATAD